MTVDDEAERLRAERDELRAELERLQQRSSLRSRWRRPVAIILVVLTCVSLVAAVAGTWTRRNFLDTDRFVERVAPLADDPAVQSALTARLTDELMLLIDPQHLFEEALPERGRLLAVPLAGAVEGFVGDQVATFVSSDLFARLWTEAARIAHQASVRVLRGESEVVTADDGRVTLNLLPVVNTVLKEITSASPELLGREINIPDVTVEDLPDQVITRIETALNVDLGDDFGQFTVFDDGKVEAAQAGLKLFDRLVIASLVLAIAFAALALWVSDRRRRTLLQLAAGVILGMVFVRRVAFAVEDDVAALPPTAPGRQAARVAVDAFLTPLTTFCAWSLGVAALVGAVALATGSYPAAVGFRRRVSEIWGWLVSSAGETSRDEATIEWIRLHRDRLLVAGGVAAVALLWVVDLSWVPLLVLLAVVAGFEAFVYRVGTPPKDPDSGVGAHRSRSGDELLSR